MTTPDAYDKIESAIDAPADERPHFIKQALQVLPDDHPATSSLKAALDACGENDAAARYTLRLAYGELPSPDSPDEHALPVTRPPRGVRWLGENWGVVTLFLADPLIEWIDIERNSEQSVTDWIEAAVCRELDADFRNNHGFRASVEVEVPADFALRARLKARDRRLRGEPTDANTVAQDYMSWDATFTNGGTDLSETPDREERGDGSV